LSNKYKQIYKYNLYGLKRLEIQFKTFILPTHNK